MRTTPEACGGTERVARTVERASSLASASKKKRPTFSILASPRASIVQFARKLHLYTAGEQTNGLHIHNLCCGLANQVRKHRIRRSISNPRRKPDPGILSERTSVGALYSTLHTLYVRSLGRMKALERSKPTPSDHQPYITKYLPQTYRDKGPRSIHRSAQDAPLHHTSTVGHCRKQETPHRVRQMTEMVASLRCSATRNHDGDAVERGSNPSGEDE